MNFHRFFLKTANSLVSLVVILFLTVAGVYSGYALWDNAQVYAAVDDVQSELLKLKPDAAEEDGASFEELLAVNPDVCAWLTLDNTGIDYPVVQGEDNLSYINTDVYGEFALAGSIFLDSSCDNTFHDQYSLLYGHHMENSKMFGDLDLYEDEEFFNENTTGMLILPDRSYELEIFACLRVSASEDAIFYPQQWQTNTDGLLEFVSENAMHIHQDTEAPEPVYTHSAETGRQLPQIPPAEFCSLKASASPAPDSGSPHRKIPERAPSLPPDPSQQGTEAPPASHEAFLPLSENLPLLSRRLLSTGNEFCPAPPSAHGCRKPLLQDLSAFRKNSFTSSSFSVKIYVTNPQAGNSMRTEKENEYGKSSSYF